MFTIVLFSFLCTFFFLSGYRKEKASANDGFEIAGFAYEKTQDIFYSVIDAWQRNYGYCQFYDEMATPLSLVIDAEPVIFEYNHKLWLIEFWKGQYGMTTGAEVGIYKAAVGNKKIKNVFFNSISDDEMLDMSYVLLKNNKLYFSRAGKHWWLTGFKLGDFANPDELKMYITINFNNLNMCYAFVNELIKKGYTNDDIKVIDTKAHILFNKPYSKQPWTRMKLLDNIAQGRNKLFVDEYQKITAGADNFPDKINLLKQKNIKLYNKLMNIGLPRKVYAPITYLKKRKTGE